MANQVEVEIVAKLDKIDSQLRKLEDNAKKTGKKVGDDLGDNMAKRVTGSFKNLAGAAVAATAAIVGAFSLKKGINDAVKAEIAINRLNQSLASAGTFSTEASLSIQRYANELERTTTLEAESALAAFSLARNFTKTNEEAQKLTSAAIELSAALGIGLDTAVDKLGRSLSGNSERLARQIPALRGLSDEALRSGAAIDIVLDRFGGSAVAQVNTFGGAMIQLKHAFGAFVEEFGNFIVQSPVVRELIKFISAQFMTLAQSIAAFRDSAGDLLGSVIIELLKFSSAITNYVVGPFELAFNIANLFFRYIQTGFATVFSAVLEIANALAEVSFFKLLAPKLNEDLQNLRSFMGEYLFTLTQDTDQALSDVFGSSTVTDSAQKFVDNLLLVATQAKNIEDGMKNNTVGTTKQMSRAYTDFGKLLSGSVTNLITSSLAHWGSSMIKSADGWQRFVSMSLNILGDFAIQLGTMIIASALAIEALKTKIMTFAPGAWGIVAGAALVVVGGALKAFGGGPAGVGTPDTSGGGIAAGTGAAIGDNAASFTDVERQTPGQNIEVNIAGSVLGDRRALGREVAEAINEAFGFDGAVVTSGAIV